jgi:hypothetical protein
MPLGSDKTLILLRIGVKYQLMEAGKKKLLAALAEAQVAVIATEGRFVHLAHKVTIEVEGPSLFKLSEDGHSVAPFTSANEIAGFIQMDWIQRGR